MSVSIFNAEREKAPFVLVASHFVPLCDAQRGPLSIANKKVQTFYLGLLALCSLVFTSLSWSDGCMSPVGPQLDMYS